MSNEEPKTKRTYILTCTKHIVYEVEVEASSQAEALKIFGDFSDERLTEAEDTGSDERSVKIRRKELE